MQQQIMQQHNIGELQYATLDLLVVSTNCRCVICCPRQKMPKQDDGVHWGGFDIIMQHYIEKVS